VKGANNPDVEWLLVQNGTLRDDDDDDDFGIFSLLLVNDDVNREFVVDALQLVIVARKSFIEASQEDLTKDFCTT
jgi:hypothetical protein